MYLKLYYLRAAAFFYNRCLKVDIRVSSAPHICRQTTSTAVRGVVDITKPVACAPVPVPVQFVKFVHSPNPQPADPVPVPVPVQFVKFVQDKTRSLPLPLSLSLCSSLNSCSSTNPSHSLPLYSPPPNRVYYNRSSGGKCHTSPPFAVLELYTKFVIVIFAPLNPCICFTVAGILIPLLFAVLKVNCPTSATLSAPSQVRAGYSSLELGLIADNLTVRGGQSVHITFRNRSTRSARCGRERLGRRCMFLHLICLGGAVVDNLFPSNQVTAAPLRIRLPSHIKAVPFPCSLLYSRILNADVLGVIIVNVPKVCIAVPTTGNPLLSFQSQNPCLSQNSNSINRPLLF